MPVKKRGSSLSEKKDKPKTKKESVLTSDQIRIRLLKTEVHYSKGLAISITVLIFCVFIAFGVLFSAMYLETRASRVMFQEALKDVLPAGFNIDSEYNVTADNVDEEVYDEDIVYDDVEENLTLSGVNMDFETWLSFSKYGVLVYFPNSWTYFDRPFEKQIHFFADGLVRADNSTEIGDLVVSFADENNYKELTAKLVSVAGKIGFRYDLGDSQEIIIANNDKYIEISYTNELEQEVVEQILENFQIIE